MNSQILAEASPLMVRNHMVSSFYADPKHAALFSELIDNPTSENKRKLEEAFQRFFFGIRFTKYMCSLIRFADIDYHRKRIKREDRNKLVFDSPAGEEGQITLGEYLMSRLPESPSVFPTFNPEHFEASLDDPDLSSVFSKLTDRQKTVVTLSYSAHELDTEIATRLNVSQQSITKTRISALKKMRKALQSQNKMPRSRMERC